MAYDLQIFADGSCHFNGQPNAYGGAAVWVPNFGRSRTKPLPTRPTNQSAELWALKLALDEADNIVHLYQMTDAPTHLYVMTDSAYVCGIFQPGEPWITMWHNNGWINAQGVYSNVIM